MRVEVNNNDHILLKDKSPRVHEFRNSDISNNNMADDTQNSEFDENTSEKDSFEPQELKKS